MPNLALELVETDQRLPLHERIRDVLASRITSKKWPLGTMIPPEQAIAAELGVALGTVRRALGSLVDKGLVERRQGVGTFVKRADFSNSLFRFFQLSHEDGTPIFPEGRTVEHRKISADAFIAEKLGLKRGDPVLYIHRLRSIAVDPLLVERIWLPYTEFAALADLDEHEWQMLLYRLYEKHCARSVARTVDHLSFGSASQEEASHLKLPAKAPVLVIERAAYGIEGRPIEWRRSIGDAKLFKFKHEMT
jgi:GntR family transcriptional regulator